MKAHTRNPAAPALLLAAVAAAAVLPALRAPAQQEIADWLESHARPTVTEVRTYNASNDLVSVTVTKQFKVEIELTETELRALGASKVLEDQPARRSTMLKDELGQRVVREEEKDGAFETVEVKETLSTPMEGEEVVRRKNRDGDLRVTDVSTESHTIGKDGSLLIVIEKRKAP
jgi:hypothetical protein